MKFPNLSPGLTRLILIALLACSGCSSGGKSGSGTSGGSSSSSSSASSSSAASSSSSGIAVIYCGYTDEPPVISVQESTQIEAENYDTCEHSFADSDPDNLGAAYRQDAVDIYPGESSEQHYVGSTTAGEYLQFSVQVQQAGNYRFQFRLGGLSEAVTLAVERENSQIAPVAFSLDTPIEPDWQDVTGPQIYLSDGLQVLKVSVKAGHPDIDFFTLTYAEPAAASPQATVTALGIGINLGNTLDAPHEGEWAAAAQPEFLADFAVAGFGHIRVPVTWHNHVGQQPPYAIDPEFLDRVETVIDWALAYGDYVILNAHHESWLKSSYANANSRARFDSIWRQIADRFRNKPHRLLFEILNEPQGLTVSQIDDLNARILGIIREHNPDRLVVYSGNGYTSLDNLLAAAIPDDTRLIANFHSYDPWDFAGQCQRRWGNSTDINALTAIYDRAADWSTQNGIPVTVNEFGVAHFDSEMKTNVCNPDDRLVYLATHAKLARERSMGATVWDDGHSFMIYNRSQNTWGPEKDALLTED